MLKPACGGTPRYLYDSDEKKPEDEEEVSIRCRDWSVCSQSCSISEVDLASAYIKTTGQYLLTIISRWIILHTTVCAIVEQHQMDQ